MSVALFTIAANQLGSARLALASNALDILHVLECRRSDFTTPNDLWSCWRNELATLQISSLIAKARWIWDICRYAANAGSIRSFSAHTGV
jgi:hypothetical protein